MKSNFQSRRFYDTVAPEYDEIVGESTYVNELEPLLAPRVRSIQRVLDVGAGTGNSIEGILVWTRPTTIVGVDISKPMLDELREKYPQVEIVHADILEYLARDPEPFDLITAFSVLELLWDFESVAGALARKLNSGGIFAFTYEPLLPDHATQGLPETTYRVEDEDDLTYTMYRVAPDRVNAWLHRSGLQVIVERTIAQAYERDDGAVELCFVAALRP